MKPISLLAVFTALVTWLPLTECFSFAPLRFQNDRMVMRKSPVATRMSTVAIETTEVSDVNQAAMKRDRYVATNRFAVRKGQQAKFEKRWATRKSRLATLPGFKYFHLMRRVTLNEDGSTSYDEGDTDETSQENYVSFTIWNKKSDFSAWRSGDAFKEAHGGTSITAFLSTMVNSALVLRGAPRPAFFDGLHLQGVKPATVPETVDGWRNVEHDGVTTLPTECFVAMDKFFIPPGSDSLEFEKAWTTSKSQLKGSNGFVFSSLLRRDGQAKGHGIKPMESSEPNFVATACFDSRGSFEAWSRTNTLSAPATAQIKPFERSFYEGTLVISSVDGP